MTKVKFLEGKNPAERKKIIAALALGLVAVCALFYTFVLSSSGTSGANSNKNKNANVKAGGTPTKPAPLETPGDLAAADHDDILLQPIPGDPFPSVGAPDAERNIFAFYEPPPSQPKVIQLPTEKPIIPPTPTPTPPIMLGYANPSMVFARTEGFTLEVGGDRFTPESKILFAGQEVPTQFSSPQRLTAQISAAMISAEGQRQITVNTPDGSLYSNPLIFNIQAPPTPNYNFVGFAGRKRYNNDTALLQNKQTKEYLSVRLNDTIPERFRVLSISGAEVWVQDTALKLKHRLAYVDERTAGKTTGGSGSGDGQGGQGRGGGTMSNGMNNPGGIDPSVQYQEIPGIPNNIPRYIPPQPQQPPSKDDGDGDVDDDDPNR